MSFSALNTPTALSHDDADQIRSTAMWARLIGILGFIMLGVMLLFGIFMGTFITRMMTMSAGMTGQQLPFDPSFFGAFYMAIFLVMVVVYFFPTLFLYQYGARTLKALRGGFDPAAFTRGVKAHKSFYTYVGILMIITVGMYVIGGLIMGLAMAMMPDVSTMFPGQTVM